MIKHEVIRNDLHRMPPYNRTPLSRKALDITDTDDRLIAAAAMIGDSKSPVKGYSTPAATGMPTAL